MPKINHKIYAALQKSRKIMVELDKIDHDCKYVTFYAIFEKHCKYRIFFSPGILGKNMKLSIFSYDLIM